MAGGCYPYTNVNVTGWEDPDISFQDKRSIFGGENEGKKEAASQNSRNYPATGYGQPYSR